MKYKLKQIFKMLVQHFILPFVYNIHKHKKIDENLVIFADAHHVTIPEHMQPVRDALKNSQKTDRMLTLVEYYCDSKICGRFAELNTMISFMKLYAIASVVIICDNYLPVASCKKRSETCVIQLWHGSGAFKKFGYDTSGDIPKGYIGNVFKNYNLVTASGKKTVKCFESAMRQENGIVKPFGNVVTDKLFDISYKTDTIAKIFARFSYLRSKKLVLYAPTFRGRIKENNDKQLNLLSEIESNEYMVVASVHPHLTKTTPAFSSEELMLAADVLITDYSSLFFDYLLLDKPIIFYAPDYEEYAKERDFYLDYSTLPGIIVYNEEDLRAAIEEAIFDDDEYRDRRKEWKKNYMEACDGHASERVCDFIVKHINGRKE